MDIILLNIFSLSPYPIHGTPVKFHLHYIPTIRLLSSPSGPCCPVLRNPPHHCLRFCHCCHHPTITTTTSPPLPPPSLLSSTIITPPKNTVGSHVSEYFGTTGLKLTDRLFIIRGRNMPLNHELINNRGKKNKPRCVRMNLWQ